MYWGLIGTVDTQGPEGYRDIRGHWGAPMGCQGAILEVSGGIRRCRQCQGCIGVASGLGA